MKTEKLTLDICFKYPNASILNTWSNGNSKTDIETFLWRKGENIGNNISDCKLILRPLSSLTDEEKKVIRDKYIPVQLAKMMTDVSWLAFKSLIQYCDKNKIIDCIDYLRSINIDIDGLQEKGVAVYD